VTTVLFGGLCWYGAITSSDVLAQENNPLKGMVAVPGGTFTMGRDDGPVEERPAHKVFLPTFYIDRDLVTVEQYARFVQAKGTEGSGGEMYLDVYDEDNRIHPRGGTWLPDVGYENYPVGEVSWYGAMEYCRWLGKRLPSEAEWEKAARGTDGRLYPWGNWEPRPDLAFFGAMRGETVPVGQFPRGKSPYGVHDMAGQMWEWTTSIYAPYPYNKKDGREDIAKIETRVARGGSSSSSAIGLTATSRQVVYPSRAMTGHAYFGFRCVKTVETVTQLR
jgi:iron(II)-dependent oxidoreductase